MLLSSCLLLGEELKGGCMWSHVLATVRAFFTISSPLNLPGNSCTAWSGIAVSSYGSFFFSFLSSKFQVSNKLFSWPRYMAYRILVPRPGIQQFQGSVAKWFIFLFWQVICFSLFFKTLQVYTFFVKQITLKITRIGTSLVVQWLRLWAPNAGGPGSIPFSGN